MSSSKTKVKAVSRFKKLMEDADSSTTKSSVPVFQCRFCGSLVASVQGAERHQNECRFARMTSHNSAIQHMVIVHFPCPLVVLERLNVSPQETDPDLKCRSTGNFDDSVSTTTSQRPLQRKSSLRALQKYQQLESDSEEDINRFESSEIKSEDDALAWSSGENGNDSDFEVNNTKGNRKRRSSTISRRRNSNLKPDSSTFRRPRKARKVVSQDLKNYYNFRCKHCPSRFNLEKLLNRHENCVHGEGSVGRQIFTCPVCKRMFHTRLIFQGHVRNHENAEALEKSFDLWNGWPPTPKGCKQHFKCSCKYCVIPLLSHQAFLEHMKTDHSDKDRYPKFSCPYCSADNMESMKLLFRHIQTMHSLEFYGTEKKIEANHPEKIDNKFSGTGTLGRRIKVYKRDNPYQCPLKICGAKLKGLAQLKSHFILHLENNPFVCTFPGCTVRCDAQCHLIRHIKLHTAKPIPCLKCGYSYSRLDKLKNHKCGKNPRPKSYFYDNYGYRRSSYANLRLPRLRQEDYQEENHSSGSGLQNEEGDIKDIKENNKAEWNGHVKRRFNINKIIESDPVFIQVCKENPNFRELIIGNKMYKRKGRELDSNTYVKCNKCPARFGTEKRLKEHISQMHTYRPHKCSKCMKRFLSKSALLKHMIVHEVVSIDFMIELEDGKCQCAKCGAIRANEQSLKRHWFLIHKVKLPYHAELIKERMANRTKSKSKPKPRVVRSKKKRAIRKKVFTRDFDSDEEDVDWEVYAAKDRSKRITDVSIVKVEAEVEPNWIEVEMVSPRRDIVKIECDLGDQNAEDVLVAELHNIKEERSEMDCSFYDNHDSKSDLFVKKEAA